MVGGRVFTTVACIIAENSCPHPYTKESPSRAIEPYGKEISSGGKTRVGRKGVCTNVLQTRRIEKKIWLSAGGPSSAYSRIGGMVFHGG